MPNNDHTRNVKGLLSHAVAKSEAVARRIDSAIRTLMSRNAEVNFNAVATLAHVSKTTLYSNQDYRARIEHLRRNTSPVSSVAAKRAVTDKGKDVIIAAKNKRISELEAEVERLSGILERCYANEYENF